MPKYGLKKQPKGAPSYTELQKHGYDPKSAQKAGLESGAKWAAIGAGLGVTGGPAGIAAGAGIGAAVGFVGGFTYDMISGGDNLSQALDSYKLSQDSAKLAKQVARTEFREQKSQKGKAARSPDLPHVAQYDDTAMDIMALSSGAGTSQYDQYLNKTYGVG
tara:strand:- start:706 stop:1188 length:483 start_codon:yes stop_codon:yes gene_type:complete